MMGLRLGLGLSRRGGSAAFAPAALFASAEKGAWYDPSDLTSLKQNSDGTGAVTADGDPVGYMADKSGNGNHLIMATAAARPLYKTSGGLHWLLFDNVDDRMRTALFASSIASPYTRLVALARTTVDFAAHYISDGGADDQANLLFKNDAGNSVEMYAGVAGIAISGAGSTTNDLVIESAVNGASSRLRIDLGAAATGNAGTNTLTGLSLGALAVTNNFFTGMRFHGMILRQSLSDADTDSARVWLAAKQGRTL